MINFKQEFPSLFGDDVPAVKKWRRHTKGENRWNRERSRAATRELVLHIRDTILPKIAGSYVYGYITKVLTAKCLSSRHNSAMLLDEIIASFLEDNEGNDFSKARLKEQHYLVEKSLVPTGVVGGGIPIDHLHMHLIFEKEDDIIRMRVVELKYTPTQGSVPLEQRI